MVHNMATNVWPDALHSMSFLIAFLENATHVFVIKYTVLFAAVEPNIQINVTQNVKALMSTQTAQAVRL